METAEALREALITAGAAELEPGARAWVENRLSRFGYSPAAKNLGGLRCALPHEHATEKCAAAAAIGRPRPLAVFESLSEAAGALVATARRAGAAADRPADDLEGFRSVHTSGPIAPEEAAKRFRALTADWEAFERQGVRDPTWRTFRDGWWAGRPQLQELSAQEAQANQVRALLSQSAGGLVQSDDATARLLALRARVGTHDTALADAKTNPEPEVVEYVKRWEAFKGEMVAAEERSNSTFSWVSDIEVSVLEAHYNNLVDEWDLVGKRITVRKGKAQVEVLTELNKQLADGKKYPSPALPSSAATKVAVTPPPGSFSLPRLLPAGPSPFGLPFEEIKTYAIAAGSAVVAVVATAVALGRK